MPLDSDPHETIKLIADLLEGFLGLPHDRVMIYNQKWNLPNTTGAFVNVSIVGDKVVASNSKPVNDPENAANLYNVLSVLVQEHIQIDIFSVDSAARQRRQEVVMALRSTAAQQIQERYSFKIGNVPPSFVDLSDIEGTARLSRYALTFNVIRAYSRTESITPFTVFANPPKDLYINQ